MTQAPDDTDSPPPAATPRRSLRARSRIGGVGIALTDMVLVAMPILLLGWLLASNGGLRALAAGAQWALPALQQIDVGSGSLLSSPRFDALRYDDGQMRIEARALALDWRPYALLAGRLDLVELSIDELAVATAPSDAPPTVPAQLDAPLALRAHVSIGRLRLGDFAQPGVDAVVLDKLSARIESDGRLHVLSDIALGTPWGALSGHASLNGDAPFALSGELAFAGTDYAAQATLGGALADGVTIEARASGYGLSGSAALRALPFAVQPLAALRLALDAFDPQKLNPAAPAGQWTVEADLRPKDGDAGVLSGPVRASNGAPGRIDAQRVPVTAVSARIDASPDAVSLHELHVRLAGGGDIRGSAGWRASGELPLVAALTLHEVNAAALHGQGVPTKLGGRVDVSASTERQQFEVDIKDAGPSRIALTASGSVADGLVTLARTQLAARGAQATLAGTLRLDDSLTFAFDGALQKFDPSAFARVPKARLSATFSASGRVQPQIDARVDLAFAPSTLMGEPLGGAVKARVRGTRISDADIALDWAGNRLGARGAFGGRDDVLDWTLDAQRLQALRELTGLALAGRVQGQGRLAGTLAAPHGDAKLEMRALQLGELGSVASADIDAELAPGADGRLRLALDATDLRSPSAPAAVEHLRVDIDGSRAAHRMSADVRMAEQKEERASRNDAPVRQSLKLAAHGALGDGPAWSGVLDSVALVLSPELSATLSAPVPLSASAQRVALGSAKFALTGDGELVLDRTEWTPERIDAVGRARGVPLRLVWRDREAGVAARAPLKLGADWSVHAALTGDETLSGQLSVFREGGKVVVSGDGRVEFSLDEARVQAEFAGRTATVTARLSGPEIGSAAARVRVPMRRDDGIWQPDLDAPVTGEATLDLPSLAWIGRALRPDITTGGAVKADVRLAGRLRAPEVSGRIDGDGLAFALADLGLRLERGQLRAQFTGDRLKLENLSFESDNMSPPADARLKAAQLTREPGRLSASGEVDIATARADIAIAVRHFVPLQGGDQWLMLSGDGTLNGSSKDGMALKLALAADAGLFTVPEQSPPSLGDDVVIKGRKADAAAGPPLALQIDIDLGERLYFRGRGLDTRLAGTLALRDSGRGLGATGNIRTVDGRYRAYGQNLVIDRGVISFQGSLANPGLNVRALRPDIPVQAGVEVSGTVQRPRVRLVSDTAMPDSEKLSWIVLGRGQDAAGGSDLSLLATAAGALLGGEGDGMTGSLAQALGLDQISLAQSSTDSGPRSQVVSSSGGNTTVGGQVVSVGKRLSSNALLTYEQGISGAGSVVKLTWSLTRHLALIGSTGTEQAVDVRYVFSFK
ncbi:MAG: translocation/assembly module TamB domain-containing protein [Gammaproteobacteria bacterium]|nr:translocation/assembly module TamB domain-containing protein [Gammaproteobacteria bacterium]MBU0771052.1 translocation/assembly module TamB domain-containing protein [Gammaproteobacteria bacterium]MBU0854633.1 translocation/assembly module TamB domain-containing protein [Gammaproteobacteria bacterium]MBU1845965.1 translocation/assembly module TamB domain-containing protein [Gammaproteobacteria bacterium]